MGEQFGLAVAAIALGATSQVMSAQSREVGKCTVSGADKLPMSTGGANALCAAISKAVAARIPGVAFSTHARVISPWMIGATLTTADGRQVPEQIHAVLDATLTAASFDRIADALATKIAELPGNGE